MINTRFLYFRLQQGTKFIKEFPVPYFLLFLLLFLIVGYICFGWIKETPNASLLAGVLSVFMLYIHLQRKDYHFICLLEENSYKVFGVDYFLLSSPLLALLLIRQQWMPALLLLTAGMGISFIKQPFRKNRTGIPVPDILPFNAFEIRAGFRYAGIAMVFFYLAGWGALLLPYLSLGILFLYTACFLNCFSAFESLPVLLSGEYTPIQFLKNKLKTNLAVYGISLLPVCMAYILIYPDQWWIITYYFIVSCLNIALFIFTKYAFYIPGKKLVNGQIGVGFSFLGIILPFFAPFTLLFLIKYYRKAIVQLKPYLDAYHK